MKILVVGGTGVIGSAVVKELSARHTVIVAGHTQGDFLVDISSQDSIAALYKAVGPVDAVVCTAGSVTFKKFNEMKPEDYLLGLNNKLMGQIHLVLLGREFVNPQGSFTLTSGILSQEPIATGSCASMVNAALEGFIIGAAIEMPREIRINVVSPTVVLESMPKYAPYFRGFKPVPVEDVALAFSRSVEGLLTGQVLQVK